MSYVAQRRLERRLKCFCGCLSPAQMRELAEAVRDYGVETVVDLFSLSCTTEECETGTALVPSPGGGPLLPPGATCPGGDCGSAIPGGPLPPPPPPLQGGGPGGNWVNPGGSVDKPPMWVCNPVVRSMVLAGQGALNVLPKNMQFTIGLYDALCSGTLGWSKARGAFCKTMKVAATIGLITPLGPAAGIALAAVEALCPEEGSAEVKQVEIMVQQKQSDPKEVVNKLLNPAGTPIGGLLTNILAQSAPSMTGNPYADLLAQIVSGAGAKAPVITSVLEAMGIKTGPGGQVAPDNGVSFTDEELAKMAAGIVGAVIGYADILTK